jgi:hypothetical protein
MLGRAHSGAVVSLLSISFYEFAKTIKNRSKTIKNHQKPPFLSISHFLLEPLEPP